MDSAAKTGMPVIRLRTATWFVLVCLAALAPGIVSLAASDGADRVLGVWLNEPGDGLIRIEKAGEVYFGTIAGAPEGTNREPDARDVNNPDPALRERPLVGLKMMDEYRYDGKRWSGGWIYDPDNGKRYRSRLTMRRDGTLEVRGYIGAPMLGRTQVWKRYAEPPRKLSQHHQGNKRTENGQDLSNNQAIQASRF